MKKLIITGLLIGAVSIGGTLIGTSASPEAEAQADASSKNEKAPLPPTDINGIMVPFDVLIYAQMKYVGHAVTHAEKTYLNGQEVYRLRVDRDINTNDYESIYLYYTLKWKLIEEKSMTPPPTPSLQQSSATEAREEVIEEEKPQTSHTPNDEEPPQTGNNGSDGSQVEDDGAEDEEALLEAEEIAT